MTFPDILTDMTVDSNAQCEVRMSNIVQKCQIFYEHNTVTSYNKKERKAVGKVLIIVNKILKNRLENIPEDQKA